MAEHARLAEDAAAHAARGEMDAALTLYRQAVAQFPTSAVAEHNLAGHLADMGVYAEAERRVSRARRLGLDAPETWRVQARVLHGLLRWEEAQAAYREALRRRPQDLSARRELAQLVWMQTADVDAALASLDALDGGRIDPVGRAMLAADLHKHAGQPEAAYACVHLLAAQQRPNLPLQLMAAHLAAAAGDAEAGLAHAEAAAACAPEDAAARVALSAACLAVGDPARAASLAQSVLARAPFDQAALAHLGLAWRLLGEPRYGALFDYPSLVGVYDLQVPEGWRSMAPYLATLAQELNRRHVAITHPLNQSLRHGSQSAHLAADPAASIQAFFAAISAPIADHLARLGSGTDPVRARNRGAYRLKGAWSVRLRPGGFHEDHIHPEGWLSSAFYVSLPDAAKDANAREGWLKFGEPGVPTRPHLSPERFVQPAPGRLVLFPAYMWHGTRAFGGEAPRLSIAFDLVPG